MVATIRPYERRVVEQAVSPTPVRPGQTSLGDLASGLNDVGDALYEMQDEVDTADAKAADAAYSDLIRQELYADESGFMYTQGGNSINNRGAVSERIKAEQERILGDLSPAARRRAQSAMEARYQRALTQIDQHTAGERRSYLNGAAQARITSGIQDAIYNPDQVAQSIASADQELVDMAAREGWSPEETKLKRIEARTEIHSGIIGRLATADPVAALEYLRTNKGQMAGQEVARLEASLVPMVRRRVGRDKGIAAAMGLVDPAAFNWSKYSAGGAAARADSFTGLNQDFAGRVATMLVAAEADGVNLKVTSAYRSNELQAQLFEGAVRKYGSESAARKWVAPPGRSQHNTGMAVDFAGANGGLLRDKNSKEAQWLKANAERFGLHLPMSWEPWQVEMSGSRGGSQVDPQLMGGGINSLMEIQDPEEQAAAIRAYNMVTGAKDAQKRKATDAAIEAASDIIIRGGTLDSLTIEQVDALGPQGHTSMMAYEEAVNADRIIQTDDSLYVELFDDVANNPQKIIEANPAEWRSRLDDGDFQYFVKLRADLIAGERKGTTASAPTISTLRTAAKTSLEAAGIDDPEDVSAFESSLLRWSSDFTQANGAAPGPLEMNEQINKMLVPITINPKGLKRSGPFGAIWDTGKFNGSYFQVDFDGSPLTADDDLMPEDLRDGRLTINGEKVSNEVIEAVVNRFIAVFERPPTMQEMMDALIGGGLFNG